MKQSIFLVRMWRERPTMPWRFTVTEAHTNTRHSFATVAEFMAFLTVHLENNKLPDVLSGEVVGYMPSNVLPRK